MAESVGGLIVSMGMDVSKMAAGAEQAKAQARIAGEQVGQAFNQAAKAASKNAYADAIDAEFESAASYEAKQRMRRYNAARIGVHMAGDAGVAMYGGTLGIGGEQYGGSRSAAIGRGIAQLGFAGQDFASVLEGGGRNALSRALMSTMNNVQMLGAAFGPWGLALTAIGGTLGAILIPKLLEQKSATDLAAESAKNVVPAFTSLADRMNQMSHFTEALADVDTKDAFEALSKKSGRERDDLETRNSSLQAAINQLTKTIENYESTTFKRVLGLNGPMAGMLDVVGDMRIAPVRAELENAFEEARKLAADLLDASERARTIASPEAKREASISAYETRRAKEEETARDRQEQDKAREGQRLQNRADQLRDAARTPKERAEAMVKEVGELYAAGRFGIGGQETALKIGNDIIDDFVNSQKKQGKENLSNEAAVGGTASGFKALIESINQRRNDPQTEATKQAVEELKKLVALATANKPAPAPVSEGLD